MFKKFVKDRAHNRYEAYCCEDIEPRLKAIEEKLEALVAGTIPDGSVTLAKLANDARTYTREINSGTLFSEWIGTRAQYDVLVEQNGGNPPQNVRYTITDDNSSAQVTTDDYAVGSLMVVIKDATDGGDLYAPYIGDTVDGLDIETSFRSHATWYKENPTNKNGTWRCIGYFGRNTFRDGTTDYTADFFLFQRIR